MAPPVPSLRDDIASTAFFYLGRPTANRPDFPGADDLELAGELEDPLR